MIEHPLLVEVGPGTNKAHESHIFDSIPPSRVNSVQTERLKTRLETMKYAKEILDHGIIMHFTPSYTHLDHIEDIVVQTLEENGKTVKDAKFLFMLRYPTSRASSSWWFKNHCYEQNQTCPQFKHQMNEGILSTHEMVACFARHNLTLDVLVNGLRDGRQNLTEQQAQVLHLCPIKLMVKDKATLNIGKSVYVYQLAHWFNRIPWSQIHLIFLEHFIADPVREVEMLFKWLGVDTYGPMGYQSREVLYNLTQRQYNVHPIPADVQKVEVAPWKEHLDEFYRPFNRALQMLLRPSWSPFHRVPSGNWSELVDEVLKTRLLDENKGRISKNTIKV